MTKALDRTVVFERDRRVYLVGSVAPINPSSTEVEEYAFAKTLREQAPNDNIVWLRGQYVEAEKANLNGAEWSSDELSIKALTPMLMPVTVMHDPRTAVGLIADTKLLTPEAAGVPRARIDTTLGLWAHRFPEVVEEAMHNYRNGGLMQSMECVPVDTEILTRRGWLRHDQLRSSDETVGFNPANGKNEWTPIRSTLRKRAPVVRLMHGKWGVDCTEGHRWLVSRGGRSGSRIEFAAPAMTRTDELPRLGQLKLSADAALAGDLPTTPQEAAVIGWIAGDGTFRARRKSLSASITQAKPDGIMAVEMALADAGVDYTLAVKPPIVTDCPVNAQGVAIRQNHAAHKYSLATEDVKRLWRRSELDHLSWCSFILQISDAARRAWLDAMYQAEGNENHGSKCISQQEGPLKEAVALAAYLCGYRPVSHSYGEGDNAQANSHVRLCRDSVNTENLRTVALGDQEVWCPTTDLGTWTMRQGGQIMLTGNCSYSHYDCTTCGKSYPNLPERAERKNWCAHLQATGNERAARRLRDITFTGTGLIFGSRGAKGAYTEAHLEVFQEEVAEFHERANTDRGQRKRRKRHMDTIEIDRSEYDSLKAAAARVPDLESQAAAAQTEAAKVPELERSLEAAETAKVAAETARDEAKAKVTEHEEAARTATLASERLGKLGTGFTAKLGEFTKGRLTAQAGTLSDEDWDARLQELEETAGVKRDDGAAAGGDQDTFTREEVARTATTTASNGDAPSPQVRSSVVGGLLKQLTTSK